MSITTFWEAIGGFYRASFMEVLVVCTHCLDLPVVTLSTTQNCGVGAGFGVVDIALAAIKGLLVDHSAHE